MVKSNERSQDSLYRLLFFLGLAGNVLKVSNNCRKVLKVSNNCRCAFIHIDAFIWYIWIMSSSEIRLLKVT